MTDSSGDRPSVLFDAQAFAQQRFGGVSHVVARLMASHAARGRWSVKVFAGIHVTPLPAGQGIERVGLRLRVPDVPHTVRLLREVNRQVMRIQRQKLLGVDVYHPTWHHWATVSVLDDLPLVITIHDLIPERWPEVTSADQLRDRRRLIERAAGIVCVSNATKRALEECYPGAATKAAVAHLGVEIPDDGRPSISRRSDPYFVYIGKRDSYKDFMTLARAVRYADRRITVLAAGGGPPEPGLLRFMEDEGIEDRIRFLPNPEAARLWEAIRASCGVISTSREEGFGLPPLEGLASGVPVLLSDIAVYRELYSEWGAFFPVGDAQVLGALMTELARSGGKTANPEHLRARFSWDRAAGTVESLYESVAD